MAGETEKAKEQINLANKTIDKGIEQIEKSKIGKNIPTEISNIKFYDIVKVFLAFNQILSFSTFLNFYFLSMDKARIARYIGTFLYYSYFIVSVVSNVIDNMGVFTALESLLIGAKIAHMVKIVIYGGFLIVGFLVMGNLLAKFFFISYVITVVLADMTFLYYFILYYKRVKSPEYNEYGNAYTEEERENMATENSV